MLSGFQSSFDFNLINCGDINVHVDVECFDKSRFNDILQCCNMVQGCTGHTHILGQTKDVLIFPCDSDFAQNIRVGDFISDQTVIRYQLDFSHPETSIERLASSVSQEEPGAK